MRTPKEVEAMLGNVLDKKERIDHAYRGMTYAEGVESALRWVMESPNSESNETPYEEGDLETE